MSSSNQRPANRGFRSVLRCAISHYRQSPSLSAPEPCGEDLMNRVRRSHNTLVVHSGNGHAQGRLQSATSSVIDTPGDRIGERIHGMFDRLSDKIREFNGETGTLKDVGRIFERLEVIGFKFHSGSSP